MLPIMKGLPIPSVVELNKDVEPFVIQGTAMRSVYFNDTVKPLQFVHFSDVHAIPEMWDRLTEYVNYYKNYISFALHTGDYCGGSQEQYFDCYNNCKPCERPILNCVGNHDTVHRNDEGKLVKADKETVHKLLFNRTDDWEINFMPCDFSMTYYKDFPESNIRLVVVDTYYDVELQRQWIRERLEEARIQGMHVVTASHTTTNPITQKFDTTFHSITDFSALDGDLARTFLEEIIAEFKSAGGIHIANLVGHSHHDLFGRTDSGILNIAVECATSWNNWCDSKRVRGSKTFDCFNVVSVDTVSHIIKLVRVGDNADYYLRIKRVLCYDYIENKIVYNG